MTTTADTWATSQNPTELLAMLHEPDERLLRVAIRACRDLEPKETINWPPVEGVNVKTALDHWRAFRPKELAAFLKCLFAPPTTATVECPECREGYRFGANRAKGDAPNCPYCNGSGRIPAPPEPIAANVLTDSVIELTKLAAGPVCPKCKDGEAQEFEFDPHKGLIVYADYEMSRHPCYECDGIGHLPPDLSRLPYLGDALSDAGCQNAAIINHCRSEGPHLRECWALDLLLRAMR